MPNFLPKEYRFGHDFAFFLHDILAGFVISVEADGLLQVSVEFKSHAELEAVNSLTGEELWDWLEANDYGWVNAELAYKHITIALLSDFCHFVYEALSCSPKGKLTVTYALLRKPFKENLFYLEWLLADPEDFLRQFRFEGPRSLEPKSVEKERKIELINSAIGKTRHPNWVSAEFIYDLRYNKNTPYGFESLWNKATHLVTTFKAFSTESQNFNFVFSGDESRLSQWQHLYSFLPLLLFYTVEVIEALVNTIAVFPEAETELSHIRRVIGFILWAQNHYSDTDNELSGPLEWIKELLTDIDMKCPNCSKDIKLGKQNMKSFYKKAELKCNSCRTKIAIGNEF